MCKTIKIDKRRQAFTLVEMLVVIGIILVIAALAAAFAPRIADDTNLSRAVDNLEQWLLTAKMRAKRDGLATGIRLVQAPGDQAGFFSQVQYIQQPDPLVGGVCVGGPPAAMPAGAYQYPTGTGNYYTGGLLSSVTQPIPGTVMATFQGVDFTLGGIPPTQWNGWLVQPGDYLELRDGGVYVIGGYAATSPSNTLLLGVPNPNPPLAAPNPPPIFTTSTPYELSLALAYSSTPTPPPTTNYRIHRQPRILIGEEPLTLPNNFAVDTTIISDTVIPGNSTSASPFYWSNVVSGTSYSYDILFSPTGAVVGTNAFRGTIFLSVYDTTMTPFDTNRVGIVAVQARTGFLGAYGFASATNPFYFAQIARESGL